VAELAGTIGEREWHDDEVAALHVADVAADVFDNADCLVSHAAAALRRFKVVIRPQIAPADARARHSQERVSWLNDFRVRDVLDPNVAS
jgi:hypothetical protein